jgi:hypothetical protein
MGREKGETMNSELNEKLAAIRAALARQDEPWNRSLRALAQMGEASVRVPKSFIEGLEALAGSHPFRGDAGRV